MTARQGQASGSVIAAAAVANGNQVGKDRSSPFSWEEWFSHASPQQRATALGMAQQQGLLYPHQLPALSNGVKPVFVAKETETALLLSRLLANKAEPLPRLPLDAREFFDADLDDLQKQAVLRAHHTPDLFLLQGLPGTGKSRVLTEVIRQAAACGRRVLFLASQTVSLDVILERLVGHSEVFALRFLDAPEKLEALPAWLRGFTLEEQKQAFLERVLVGARGNHQQAEAVCRQRMQEEPLWAEFEVCMERCQDLDQRLDRLREEQPRLGESIQREAETGSLNTPFIARLAEMAQACDTARREMDANVAAQQGLLTCCDQEAADLAERIAGLESGYAAKKYGRFWTLAYWTHLFDGQIIATMESLLEQGNAAQARRHAITLEIEQLKQRQHERQQQYTQARSAVIDTEIQTRQQAMLVQIQTLSDERRRLEEQWDALCRRLNECPAAKTRDAIAAGHQAWLLKKRHVEEQCQFAQQWTKFVEHAGPQLAARLPQFANVLAGTVSRWHSDAKFRDAVTDPVDLLIIEDAESLTEADLLKLARHAQRCVLAGQMLAETTPKPAAAEKASRSLLGTPLTAARCWTRLWQALDGDAGRWPHSWRREQGRLICQLMPLSAEDCQHLESEGLADAADIELRILHRPRTRPCLAQVIFPPQRTFADAFTFMVREVQEFPLEAHGRTGWWSEDAQRCWHHLGPAAACVRASLQVEPGLSLETVAEADGADATRVVSIEFDKSAGWDRAKAESWLERHRPVRDHERTVFLQTPYRFERPLVKVVQAVVRASDWLTAGLPQTSNDATAFEFVAVPALAKHDWPREGAGLELDLSASRCGDRLPTGLRQGLPPRGFVNYLEAQALIRRLEIWMQTESTGTANRVTVLALYAGQVELLRRLVEQSEVLRARSFPLEVALPSRLHQRECDLVFLSLTRSHAHRCVAFGEDPRELPLALTRARSRLFVFGDPGSLCKRTNWHGPLEHLDGDASHQEHLRLSRLLNYVQNHTSRPVHVNGK